MDNPDPTETEQELAGTERHAEEEDMRGTGSDDDTLPTDEDDQHAAKGGAGPAD